MKTQESLLVMLSTVLFLSITSCKKYEDGPLISFRTKEERVANNWRVAKAISDGADVTDDFERYELNLSQGGDASLTAKYLFLGATYEYITTGTWIFERKKEKIYFNFSNDDADGTYKILKLMEDEMWLREDGKTLELHFVPK